jgi:hypothetical protein
MSDVIETGSPEATALPDAEAAGVEAQPGASDVEAVLEADPGKTPQETKPAVEEDPEIEFDKDFKDQEVRGGHCAEASARNLTGRRSPSLRKRARSRKQLEALKDSDPEEYFRLRGIDPLQYAVERLKREVALKEATPEQRRIMELEAKLQEGEVEKQTFAQKEEERQNTAIREQFVAKLDKELPAAVQKHGLPTDPLVFRAVAGVIADQLRAGMPEDPEGAAEIVRGRLSRHFQVLRRHPEIRGRGEAAPRVREADSRRRFGTRAHGKWSPRPTPQAAPKKPAEKQPSGKTFDDYFSKLTGGMPYGI